MQFAAHDKIYLAGHTGLVGSAMYRALRRAGHRNLVTRTHRELDLTRQAEVSAFFAAERPDFVFLCAAVVGGIGANNTRRGQFIYDNLMIQCNVLEAARAHAVRRLLFLGSSCVYPRDCPQPMREAQLLTGSLESTNEPYAIAKIAGIKMCEAYNAQYGTWFVPVMPTNLYGIDDNFDPEGSHVLPALIRRFHEARQEQREEVVIWGSGAPKREFLYADDLAEACVLMVQHDAPPRLTNIGSGDEVTIRELAQLVREIIGFRGRLTFDPGKPDGTPRKLLDSSRIRELGWAPHTGLPEGIETVYRWYRDRAGGSDDVQRPAVRTP